MKKWKYKSENIKVKILLKKYIHAFGHIREFTPAICLPLWLQFSFQILPHYGLSEEVLALSGIMK
jgi:hypothetical protein